MPLCALAIVMGVFPSLFLAPMEPSVQKVVERVQAATAGARGAPPRAAAADRRSQPARYAAVAEPCS